MGRETTLHNFVFFIEIAQHDRSQESCTSTVMGDLSELLVLEFRELVQPALDLCLEGYWRADSSHSPSPFIFFVFLMPLSSSGLFSKDSMKIKN